jgi:hypothetical protein
MMKVFGKSMLSGKGILGSLKDVAKISAGVAAGMMIFSAISKGLTFIVNLFKKSRIFSSFFNAFLDILMAFVDLLLVPLIPFLSKVLTYFLGWLQTFEEEGWSGLISKIFGDLSSWEFWKNAIPLLVWGLFITGVSLLALLTPLIVGVALLDLFLRLVTGVGLGSILMKLITGTALGTLFTSGGLIAPLTLSWWTVFFNPLALAIAGIAGAAMLIYAFVKGWEMIQKSDIGGAGSTYDPSVVAGMSDTERKYYETTGNMLGGYAPPPDFPSNQEVSDIFSSALGRTPNTNVPEGTNTFSSGATSGTTNPVMAGIAAALASGAKFSKANNTTINMTNNISYTGNQSPFISGGIMADQFGNNTRLQIMAGTAGR